MREVVEKDAIELTVPLPRKVPTYGRRKVDEILGLLENAAGSAERISADTVNLQLTTDDLLVLNDMLREMDRHLPDFFEG